MKKCKYHCDYGDGENCHYTGESGCVNIEQPKKVIKVRLNDDAICDGLLAVKDAYQRAYQDFDVVFTEGEYGTGQHKLSISVRNLLSDAVSLIKEQKETIETQRDIIRTQEEQIADLQEEQMNKGYSGYDGSFIL